MSIENDATRDVFVNMAVPEVNPCMAYKVPAMLHTSHCRWYMHLNYVILNPTRGLADPYTQTGLYIFEMHVYIFIYFLMYM